MEEDNEKQLTERLKSHSRSIIANLRQTNRDNLGSKVLTHFLNGKKSRFKSLFNEYLIKYDNTNFLRKFHENYEILYKMIKILNFYARFKQIFPNYINLKNNNILYNRIYLKNKFLNKNNIQENKQDEKLRSDHDSSFDSDNEKDAEKRRMMKGYKLFFSQKIINFINECSIQTYKKETEELDEKSKKQNNSCDSIKEIIKFINNNENIKQRIKESKKISIINDSAKRHSINNLYLFNNRRSILHSLSRFEEEKIMKKRSNNFDPSKEFILTPERQKEALESFKRSNILRKSVVVTESINLRKKRVLDLIGEERGSHTKMKEKNEDSKLKLQLFERSNTKKIGSLHRNETLSTFGNSTSKLKSNSNNKILIDFGISERSQKNVKKNFSNPSFKNFSNPILNFNKLIGSSNTVKTNYNSNKDKNQEKIFYEIIQQIKREKFQLTKKSIKMNCKNLEGIRPQKNDEVKKLKTKDIVIKQRIAIKKNTFEKLNF